MSEKSRTATKSADVPSKKSEASPIPEPLQFVTSSTIRAGTKKAKVPTLILRGEWLKAAGFPIGAAAYLILDRIGEVAVNRLGLGRPRRFKIVAK